METLMFVASTKMMMLINYCHLGMSSMSHGGRPAELDNSVRGDITFILKN